MPKLKVSLFGESWKLKHLEIDASLQERLLNNAKASNTPLSVALLDLSFFEKLNHPALNSLHDLPSTQIGGLCNTPKNQVEVWYHGKKVQKLKLDALFHSTTLFELFQSTLTTIESTSLEEGIYLIETEIGLIASYELDIPAFTIDALTFSLLKFYKDNTCIEVLSNVLYGEQLLPMKRTDVLLNGLESFVIN